VVIGTAGHIDHGKSTLVRMLTGINPDRLKEEQERGITIDLGFAHHDVGDTRLAFVDVPGHERFVKNMLAGAGGIDLVMLVVAADESVMPQTREHFGICRLLRVPAGVIVLTKIDVADADMQELAALEVRELTAGSFLGQAPIVTVSGRTGEGLEGLTAALIAASSAVPRRPIDRPARLPIDRVFTMKGFGTVVTGTLVAGTLRTDDDLLLLPSGTPVKVRGLHVHGAEATRGVAGQRVAVNLAGAAVDEVSRGDTLCVRGAAEITQRFDVALELLADARALKHGARVRFHQGTTEIIGRVGLAGGRDGRGSAAEVPPGGQAYARVRLELPAVLTRGDRFVLRAYSPAVTIGGGVVLDPLPPRMALRTEPARRRFALLDPNATDDLALVTGIAEERGGAGVPRGALVSRLGLAPSAALDLVERLEKAGRVATVEDSVVPVTALADLGAALLAAIRQHHDEYPLADGLPREEARERLFAHTASGVFERVLGRLQAENRIAVRDRLALSGHQVSLTAAEEAALGAIERTFRDARLAPPDLAVAAADMRVDAVVADRMAALLVRRRRLLRLDGLYFHSERLEELKREVQAMKEAGAVGVDIATFKERYGITRKYAIPLLEYLDRERVTRRAGASRVIL
jgi:selenocysteine-specific elongation factor